MSEGSTLTVLGPDQLRAIVREEITAALGSGAGDAEYIGTAEAAAILGYSERYLHEAIRRHGIPCTRVPGSRKLRFHVPTLRAWMDEHSETGQ